MQIKHLVGCIISASFPLLSLSASASNNFNDPTIPAIQGVSEELAKKTCLNDDVPGPLCGVYAACSALQLIGIESTPEDFITSQYVSSCGGSTAPQIVSILNAFGIEATTLTRLSAFELTRLACPVIANVRSSPQSLNYDHWVTVVPGPEGLIIFDGLQTPYVVSTAAFLGTWSGVGIGVSEHRTITPAMVAWLWRACLVSNIGIAVILLHNVVRKLLTGSMGAWRRGISIIAMSLILSVAGTLTFGDLPNFKEGIAAASHLRHAELRSATLAEVASAVEHSSALLIDARRAEDYRFGTITGAVSVPVTASRWSIRSFLDGVDRATPIIVFCQSAQCGYDELIGTQIASLGFKHVKVCDKGYAEYLTELRN